MTAASAERRDASFIVATRVADFILSEARVVQGGLGDVGHATSFCFLVFDVAEAPAFRCVRI